MRRSITAPCGTCTFALLGVTVHSNGSAIPKTHFLTLSRGLYAGHPREYLIARSATVAPAATATRIPGAQCGAPSLAMGCACGRQAPVWALDGAHSGGGGRLSRSKVLWLAEGRPNIYLRPCELRGSAQPIGYDGTEEEGPSLVVSRSLGEDTYGLDIHLLSYYVPSQ